MALIRTFISPEEVFPGRVVTYDELFRIASGLNRTEALHVLGFLNLLVASATVETELTGKVEPVRDVQTRVLREIVSRDLLAALQGKFGPSSLLDRPLLHRTQLLFAIRLVATAAQPSGGNTLQTRDDFDVLGDLLFLTNGLFGLPDPGSQGMKAVWLASQMGPLHETENPPDLSLSWPRTHDLLTQYIPAAAPHPEAIEQLERVAVFSSGFSNIAWLDLTWMLFSYWSAANFRELMKDRSRGYLSLTKPNEAVSVDVLKRAVSELGLPFEEVPDHLRLDEYTRDVLFDLTPFRQKPLWVMGEDALCIDPALLMERLGAHLFWAITNALDTPERRQDFSSVWGKGFERYCLDHLRVVFRGKKWTFVENPTDAKTNEELFDAVALRDTTALVFECKGTFVKSSLKYSGLPKPFFLGLTKKFGRSAKGGVRQLSRGIADIWLNATAKPTTLGIAAVREVFPALIVQDPIFLSGPVCRVLSDRFNVAMERASSGQNSPRRLKVWPLTVITADDLDKLSALVEATGERLDPILKMYHRTHPSRMIALGDFLSTASKRVGLDERAYSLIRARFRKHGDATMERFRNADYGGGEEPPAATVQGDSPP